IKKDNRYYFKSNTLPIEKATFCIVDIETNGSKPQRHQIIEIGAIKVRNGEIIDRYESLVRCNEISTHIIALTGISIDETKNAPSIQRVLNEFKAFIGTDIFVAHDVKFDYGFISAMFEKYNMQPMLNRHFCSIDLAERTFSSYRYGLNYLNASLQLHHTATHHRALSDAITTTNLFFKSLKLLPERVKTAEELILFSKQAKRFKRLKFDPMLKVIEEKES
ncbi:MAG: 3'-5' exonuclease, partial [Thiovulaceae bacterium]|nr:3'-5' exonuclease [Sulfurimonadaceae bacterium]